MPWTYRGQFEPRLSGPSHLLSVLVVHSGSFSSAYVYAGIFRRPEQKIIDQTVLTVGPVLLYSTYSRHIDNSADRQTRAVRFYIVHKLGMAKHLTRWCT